jgi:hypothetical protein
MSPDSLTVLHAPPASILNVPIDVVEMDEVVVDMDPVLSDVPETKEEGDEQVSGEEKPQEQLDEQSIADKDTMELKQESKQEMVAKPVELKQESKQEMEAKPVETKVMIETEPSALLRPVKSSSSLNPQRIYYAYAESEAVMKSWIDAVRPYLGVCPAGPETADAERVMDEAETLICEQAGHTDHEVQVAVVEELRGQVPASFETPLKSESNTSTPSSLDFQSAPPTPPLDSPIALAATMASQDAVVCIPNAPIASKVTMARTTLLSSYSFYTVSDTIIAHKDGGTQSHDGR